MVCAGGLTLAGAVVRA